MGHKLLAGGNALAIASMRNDPTLTKLLLHLDNPLTGSTDLRENPPVDSSTQAHELTVHHPAGGPLLMNYDGTVKKFGNASVYKAAAETVYISAADSADWALGSGAWTIDFWVYLASLPDEGRGFGVCGQWEASNKYWALRFLNDGGLYIALSYAFYPGTSATTKLRLIDNFTVGKWNHVAMVRGADAPAGNYDLRYLSFFCNGRLADVRYLVGTGFEVPDLAAPLTVGLVKVGSDSAECFLGRLDELRIVKGGAMWLKDFVPPLGPYR